MPRHPENKLLKKIFREDTLKEKSGGLTVQEAGRRGGHTTLQNQGVEHFKKIGSKGGKRTAQLYRDRLSEFGKRGGRPRCPNLEESMDGENR
jgi:general stress protein YciG